MDMVGLCQNDLRKVVMIWIAMNWFWIAF